jgi:hypothetical protein
MKNLHTFEEFLNESSKIKEVVLSNEILNFLEERGVIAPDKSQKVHKDLTAFLKGKLNESINEGNAASWSKAQLDKELKELTLGAKEAGDIDDSMAFDIADGWIYDFPGVEVAIKKHYKAIDAQGFVANRIA